jgi:hypothetical protein
MTGSFRAFLPPSYHTAAPRLPAVGRAGPAIRVESAPMVWIIVLGVVLAVVAIVAIVRMR